MKKNILLTMLWVFGGLSSGAWARSSDYNQATRNYQQKNYSLAVQGFFSAARKSTNNEERAEAKYFLGLSLMNLKMNQMAAFQFIDVIRLKDKKYLKSAIRQLSFVADLLGDDTLLNYALTKVNVDEVPSSERDMIYFRLGQIKFNDNNFNSAIVYFSKVDSESSYYDQALFSKGLAEMSSQKLDDAILDFKKIIQSRSQANITDTNKVAAQMGLARAYYQKKDWEAAIRAYSQVPRDSLYWHDVLFEQSWAYLRAARFRSALSNFHSLHSHFYQDAYIPESLLLRAIVYLYICKYDEMEKVLSLYEKDYGDIKNKVRQMIQNKRSPQRLYSDLDKYIIANESNKEYRGHIPKIVVNHLLSQGEIKREMNYVKKLKLELQTLERSSALRNSSIRNYGIKLIKNRINNTREVIGLLVQNQLTIIKSELDSLSEQAEYIRYEMINGQKEAIKKKLVDASFGQNTLNSDIEREFYIENGYQYYPFQGEYWLDEIGNYHYLGKQSCENL